MDEPNSKEKLQVELFCFPVQDKKSPLLLSEHRSWLLKNNVQ